MSNFPGSSARSFDEIVDLTPWSVEQYLSLSGWVQEDLEPQQYAVWSNERERASLLLPFDRSLRDFDVRYREALETISSVVNLEGETLALEVVAARKDVFLLRADQATLDGSIPFVEARRLIEGVQNLLVTAAASAIRPRASTAGKKPALVNDFLRDDVRMGHTLHGSFVITVLAADAVDEARRRQEWEQNQVVRQRATLRPEETDDDPVSFPRQVMTQLARGLESAHELLAADAPPSLESAIESGVTLQLLESVQAMASSEGLRELDMSFRWSRIQEAPQDVSTRVQVKADEVREVPSFVERLRRQPDVVSDSIIGQVVRLERAEGAEDGQVVVDGYVGKSRRKVKVPLSGDAYRLAISAHDASEPVSVVGTLTRKDRGWRMQPNPVIALVSDLNRS